MKNRGTERSSHPGSLRANMCMFVVLAVYIRSVSCPLSSNCDLVCLFKRIPTFSDQGGDGRSCQ